MQKSGGIMQVRLLGPLDVMVEGEPLQVSGLRRKAVLAALALHAGEVVGADRLLAAVWGDAAPQTAVNTLQSHVSSLRNILGDKGAILARPPGYVLDLGVDGTDVQAAERLLRHGEQSSSPAEAVRHLNDALALWRGPPLADVSSLAWFEGYVRRLDQLRTRVRQALSEARLAAGEHEQAVPELERMVADHPLDERLHAQLMLALYRSGRAADALAVYHRIRRTLDEDLGIEPGQVLRDLEVAILNQDPCLDVPAPAVAMVSSAVTVPAQLPAAVRAFTGRGAEQARLDAIASQAGRGSTTSAASMVIAVVSGTAGIGKTALVVHWAHRTAHRFTDGQLYVNLRGFGPGGLALDPVEVLHGFLLALGVPPDGVPADPAARASLYRSLLTGKRVLVVLDNARDARQVRPLLPGSPGCLVIVTSRSQLAGLVAAEGAYPLTLDLLSTAEARDLLAGRLGTGRVAAEPSAVGEIVTRCARLPLALAIAAARAATQSGFPLAALADELRQAAVLDAFHGGDHDTNARAVFSWSYRAVSTGAARLFRLLGLHPGPDVSVPAAASLAGIPPGQAGALLAELARAHMLTEHTPGRYGCHDLLRAFAAELVHSLDTENERQAAMHRMLDHYLYAAYAATIRLGPLISPVSLPPPGDPGWVPPADPADYDAAWAWFTTEQDVLLACSGRAAAAGFKVHTWQLAWTMRIFLNRQGRWHEQARITRDAVDAARQLGDSAALATMLRVLTGACADLGLWDEAHASGEEALRLVTEMGDQNLQASVHIYLASVYDRQGRPGEAIGPTRDALALYRTVGNQTGEAQALSSLGWLHTCLGDHEQALAFCQQALPLLQRSGDQAGQALTWDSIGYAHHNLGNYRQAIADYETALRLARSAGDKGTEATVLSRLGDTLDTTASYDEARDVLRQALAIFDQLGRRPEADEIRAKLDSGRLSPRTLLRCRVDVPLSADLGAATAVVHMLAKLFPLENTAAGSVFVTHSGDWPGTQNLPVVPTSALVPSMAT
jgi:DNA-binding SARP family transcriptional activator